MNKNVKVEIISGQQKKDPSKSWEGVRLTIGDFKHVFFPKTTFELDYIKSKLEENEK